MVVYICIHTHPYSTKVPSSSDVGTDSMDTRGKSSRKNNSSTYVMIKTTIIHANDYVFSSNISRSKE